MDDGPEPVTGAGSAAPPDDRGGRAAAAVGLGGVVALVLAAIVLGAGFRDSDVRYAPSGAWLATQGATNVAHVHAGTRQLDARVNVARAVPGIGDLAVAQGDTGIYIVDGQGCAVHRFDEVRQDLAKRPEPKALTPEASCAEARVRQGDGHVYLVDGAVGRIEEVDPQRLDERAVLELGGRIRSSAAAADGLLVVAPVDGDALVLVRQGSVVGEVPLGHPADQVRLARVGGRVVAVDRAASRLLVLDDDGGVDRQVDVPSTGLLSVLEVQGGPTVWLLDDAEGGDRLVGVDLASGAVLGPYDVPDELGDAGRPAAVGEVVVVPGEGFTVGVLDAGTGALRQVVGVGDEAVPGTGLEVVALAGRVFVHAPVGRQAAACDDQGCVVVDKQDPSVEEVEATPPEEEDPPVTATTAPRSTTTTAAPTTTAPAPAAVDDTAPTTTVAAEPPPAPTTTAPPPPPGPPGPVILTSEPSVTNTTATLRWSPAASAVVPVWYELDVAGAPQALPGPGAPQPLEHTVTGLAPDVTVEIRVRAVNAVGPGPWTIRQVTPSSAAPVAARASDLSDDLCRAAGAPGAPCGEDDGGGQVVVFWEAPPGGEVGTYDVSCGGRPGVNGVGTPGPEGLLVPADDGVPVTCTVASVVGGRQVAEARTGTVVAHGVPAKPAPVAQQGDRAVWQPVPGAEGYVVTTSAAEAPELEVGLAVSADLRAGIRVPGVYDVAVVARNDRGRSVPSDPVRFRRGLDVPVITGASPGAFGDPEGTVVISWQADPYQPTYRLRTTAPGLTLDCGGSCDTYNGGVVSTTTVRVVGLTGPTSVPIVVEAVQPGFDVVSATATVALQRYALATVSDGPGGDDALYDCATTPCQPTASTVAAGSLARVVCRQPAGSYARIQLPGGVVGWVDLARLTEQQAGSIAALPTTCPP